MKREHLLDAIGMLDDDLIVEAAAKPARRKLPVWQMATAAAAAVVVCVGAYLWPAMQPAGAAAPENQGLNNKFDLFADVADTAGGVLADGTLEEYEYKSSSESALRAPSTANKDTAGTTQGVFEPVFRTEQGRYLLVGEELPLKAKLPDDVRYLGELAATDHDKPVYPCVGTKELVGCSVWQSEDGEYLYIQSPAGGWLQATRQK